MVRFAMARAVAESPPLYAGWPQQVCTAGASTTQPASSSSLTAANPTAGRKRSTRQVTNSPTRGWLVGSSEDRRILSDTMEARPRVVTRFYPSRWKAPPESSAADASRYG